MLSGEALIQTPSCPSPLSNRARDRRVQAKATKPANAAGWSGLSTIYAVLGLADGRPLLTPSSRRTVGRVGAEAIHVAAPFERRGCWAALLFARLAPWVTGFCPDRVGGWVCPRRTHAPATPSTNQPPPHRSVITCPMSPIPARNPSGLFFLFWTMVPEAGHCQGAGAPSLGSHASRGSGFSATRAPRCRRQLEGPTANIPLPLMAMAIEVGPAPGGRTNSREPNLASQTGYSISGDLAILAPPERTPKFLPSITQRGTIQASTLGLLSAASSPSLGCEARTM